MKLWALSGLFTLAMIPMAYASESAVDCGLETPQLLRDVTVASVDAQAPAQLTRKGARPVREEAANAPPPAAAAAPRATPQPEQRRRGGSSRRIPDAMLIDGRGVL